MTHLHPKTVLESALASTAGCGTRAARALLCAALGLAHAATPRAQDSWVLIPQTTPQNRTTMDMVYDAARDRLVLFDGRATFESTGADWTLITTLAPGARVGHRLVFDPTRNRVLLFGGADPDATTVTLSGETWEWDGLAWTVVATTGPTPRRDFALAADTGRGRVLLHGGMNAGSALADTWAWDGSTWTQVATTGPLPRFDHAIAYDPIRDRSVMYGGIFGPFPMCDTWEWDGASWTEVQTARPDGAAHHEMVFDPTQQRVLLASFRSAPGTWAFDGVNWTQASPDILRIGMQLAVDTTRSRIIAYGGNGWQDNSSVWTGSGWVELAPHSQPAEDNGGNMAWDPVSRRLLLFGGQALPINPYTWSWDGVRWRQVATTGPDPRADAAMATDTGRQRVVLFGGVSPITGSGIADTWEWDGSSWTERVVQGPSPRSGAAMAYDAARARTVLFGGRVSSLGGLLGDTWEWDGTSWTNVQASGPPPQFGHIMAYDEVRGRVVLAESSSAGGTWEWDGVSWTRVTGAGTPVSMRSRATFDPNIGRIVAIDAVGDLAEFDGAQWIARPGYGQVQKNLIGFDRARSRLVTFGGGLNSQLRPARVREFQPLTPIGDGCAGTRGTPQLASRSTRPQIGTTFATQAREIPLGNAPVFGVVGFTRPAAPVPLDAIGMPGCLLQLDVVVVQPMARTTDEATWTAMVPGTPSIVGLQFFVQAFVLDAAVNALGVTVSNGISAIIES